MTPRDTAKRRHPSQKKREGTSQDTVVTMPKTSQAKGVKEAAPVDFGDIEIDMSSEFLSREVISDYLTSLHSSVWGQVISIVKENDKERAINYIMELFQGLRDCAEGS